MAPERYDTRYNERSFVEVGTPNELAIREAISDLASDPINLRELIKQTVSQGFNDLEIRSQIWFLIDRGGLTQPDLDWKVQKANPKELPSVPSDFL